MTESELFAVVEETSETFVAALRAGEASTNGWSAREISQTLVDAALDACLARLAATDVWGPENRLASGKFWDLTGGFFQHGEMLTRARFKPRGYAGDYLLLRRICESWKCEHPLGHLFDDHFQRHAAPQAVRNRTKLVAEAIVDAAETLPAGPLRIVSLGSGPAFDLWQAASELDSTQRQRLQVVLLDLDPQALEAARARLETLLAPSQITTIRENLYRLARRPAPVEIVNAHVVACTGFFDYLPDADAALLLQYCWSQLAAGGRLMVFNFAPHNPSRALMEWVANWYLIYRDETQMHQLAQAAGLQSNEYHIGAEEVGVDLYIDARK
jgi:hypothetical protein